MKSQGKVLVGEKDDVALGEVHRFLSVGQVLQVVY